MEDKDRERFASAMAKLSLIYPTNLVEETVELFWAALKDFPVERFAVGLTEMVRMRTSTMFPTPGEIREYVLRVPVEDKGPVPFERMTDEDRKWNKMNLMFVDLVLKRQVDIEGKTDEEIGAMKNEFLLSQGVTKEWVERMSK